MEDLRVTVDVVIPAEELRVRFARAGGPGGQNVNKRSTKVEVRFDIGASRALTSRQRDRLLRSLAGRLGPDGTLRVAAQDERTQAANRERALARLRALLARGLRPPPPPRRPTRPSAAARDRRLEAKKRRGRLKRSRRPRPDED